MLGWQVRSRSAEHSWLSQSGQKELLQEDEEDCGDEADEGSDVVPLQALAFEEEVYDYREDYQ